MFTLLSTCSLLPISPNRVISNTNTQSTISSFYIPDDQLIISYSIHILIFSLVFFSLLLPPLFLFLYLVRNPSCFVCPTPPFPLYLSKSLYISSFHYIALYPTCFFFFCLISSYLIIYLLLVALSSAAQDLLFFPLVLPPLLCGWIASHTSTPLCKRAIRKKKKKVPSRPRHVL